MNKATSREIDELIHRTISGDKQAQEFLFGEIQQAVTNTKLRPLGPYSDDPDCVAEVCARVVTRFLVHDFKRLRQYLERPDRCFWSLLHVVTTRVAIDLARGMRQNVASRDEATFRWVQEIDAATPDRSQDPDPASRLNLLDVYRYLYTRADPADVDMLQRAVQSPMSWHEIARMYDINVHTARQRVRRLRYTMRAWMERHDR